MSDFSNFLAMSYSVMIIMIGFLFT
jgi:hypothetical protein